MVTDPRCSPILTDERINDILLKILFENSCLISPDTTVSTNNKTDRYDKTEILLKVALNPKKHKPQNHEP
jgi:hypothetical protein